MPRKNTSSKSKLRIIVGGKRGSSKVSQRLVAVLVTIAVLVLGFAWYTHVQNGPKGLIAETAYVQITNTGFVPQTIKVKRGTSIVWTNTDGATHQIADSQLDSDTELNSDVKLKKGESFQTAIENRGRYNYNDALHPNTFTGVIIVE